MNKFLSAVSAVSPQIGDHLSRLFESGDVVSKRLLQEYGAVFVARGGVKLPEVVIFRDSAEVDVFQSILEISKREIGGFSVELQTPAMAGLQAASADATAAGLTITPRGADSARRGYDETVALWLSRVEPALEHWTAERRLSETEADHIRSLTTHEQIEEVLKLEEQGIYFAKDLSKSILYSVAPPGTSQHLSLLAFDVAEFENASVREILGRYGWFQTVVSDLPHFTFLGTQEAELPTLGLMKVQDGGFTFWVPDLSE
jgi:hypothetical protein